MSNMVNPYRSVPKPKNDGTEVNNGGQTSGTVEEGSFEGHSVKVLGKGNAQTFHRYLVEKHGERITEFALSGNEKLMGGNKPLSERLVKKITKVAEKVEKLVSQSAPGMIEKSLKKAGIEGPYRGSEEWKTLVDVVTFQIRTSDKFQNLTDTKKFEEIFQKVVDDFVDANREPLEELSKPKVKFNKDCKETFRESYPDYRRGIIPEGLTGPQRYDARDEILKEFRLHDDGDGSFDLKKHGITTDKKLGGGGYGEVFSGNFGGKSVIVKTMPPAQMSLDRDTGKFNEAISMYLVSDQHENFSERVHIVPPSYYMISVVMYGRREDRVVEPGELRKILDNPDSIVACQGIIMNSAPGDEGGTLVKGGLEEWAKRQYVKGMLDSIKGLNERGFVHHDLKPANTFFAMNDKTKSGTTTLIDTGMLSKLPKDRETTKHPQYIGGLGGTPVYMHPRAIRGEPHGTETDLYALGVIALEVDHPRAYQHLIGSLNPPQQTILAVNGGITRDWLLAQLTDGKIKDLAKELKDDLISLRNDLDNPHKLSSFALQCLDDSRLPAGGWNNRKYAQELYSELLNHPGLQSPPEPEPQPQ